MEDILLCRNANKNPAVQMFVFEIKSEIKFFVHSYLYSLIYIKVLVYNSKIAGAVKFIST